ncbi:MAG TPA: carboxypeptidase-like regulatory domain-containing protein, partial [Planctomycetota bacterium]|nr:carboxypeptidase-like regulatory domain-containing protein [Planctomycetota bacterium]
SGTEPASDPAALPGATASDRQLVTEVPAAPPSPMPTELRGRVVTRRGDADQPVAGAEVLLQLRDADDFWNLDLEYGTQVLTMATCRSDGDGRFAFVVDRGRPYSVQARATGFAPATVGGARGGMEITLVVAGGATIEVTVREQQGDHPVAGARVEVHASGTRTLLCQGTTFVDSTFRAAGLPAGKVYVKVHAPLRLDPDWHSCELRPGEICRVEVRCGAAAVAAHGRVTDAVTGAPIVGAEVAASWVFEEFARTDGDGRYELRELEPGGHAELHVRAAGYGPEAVPIVVAADGVARDFALQPGGIVVGRLLDRSDHAVTEAYVAAGSSFAVGQGYIHTDWLRAVVDPSGRFVASGLHPARAYSLYIRCRGFGTRSYQLPRPVAAGERFDVGDVRLLPAGGVEGVVFDEAGQPFAGVEVGLSGHNRDQLLASSARPDPAATRQQVDQFESRDQTTGEDGVFRFAGVAAGDYHVRTSLHNQNSDSGPIVVVDGEVLEGLRLVLQRGLSLRGRVVQPDGSAPGERFYIQAVQSGSSSMAQGAVAADGTLVLDGIGPGRWHLQAWSVPGDWVMPALEVEAGAQDLRIVLQQAAFIRGSVLGVDGKPCVAQLYFIPDTDVNGSAAIEHTAADGTFRLKVGSGVRGKLTVMEPEGGVHRVTVEDVAAGAEGLVLQLK